MSSFSRSSCRQAPPHPSAGSHRLRMNDFESIYSISVAKKARGLLSCSVNTTRHHRCNAPRKRRHIASSAQRGEVAAVRSSCTGRRRVRALLALPMRDFSAAAATLIPPCCRSFARRYQRVQPLNATSRRWKRASTIKVPPPPPPPHPPAPPPPRRRVFFGHLRRMDTFLRLARTTLLING